MPLALHTFGQFLKPSADPANAGFHALNDPVLERVDQAPGLIARSGYASDPGPASWHWMWVECVPSSTTGTRWSVY